MEKYGFVYLWYDCKRKMFYIGSHWGNEDDGYVCSSRRMGNAYRRRKQDFRRRILQLVKTNRKELLEVEGHWLSKIKESELGSRYYNLTNHTNGHWMADENRSKYIRQKISESVRRSLENPETKAKKAAAYKTRKVNQSQEVREKRRQTMLANGKNKGKITAKDKYGNVFHTTKNDPRWATGEITHNTKGIKRGPISEMHKTKIKETGTFRRLNATVVHCKHCGKEGNVGSIARHHNDRCKQLQLGQQQT